MGTLCQQHKPPKNVLPFGPLGETENNDQIHPPLLQFEERALLRCSAGGASSRHKLSAQYRMAHVTHEHWWSCCEVKTQDVTCFYQRLPELPGRPDGKLWLVRKD